MAVLSLSITISVEPPVAAIAVVPAAMVGNPVPAVVGSVRLITQPAVPPPVVATQWFVTLTKRKSVPPPILGLKNSVGGEASAPAALAKAPLLAIVPFSKPPEPKPTL